MSKKDKVSFILPSRNERWVFKTVQSILDNCEGDLEVIVVFEEYMPPEKELIKDDRVIYIYHAKPKGLRGATNAAAAIATGKYLCKADAHVMFDKNFDTKMKALHQPNIVQIPQRRRLDAINWCEQIQDNPRSKPHVDFEYLSYPDDPKDFGGKSITGKIWTKRILEEQHLPSGLTCAFQGSCWWMERDYFNACGFMHEDIFGDFWQEAQEIALFTYLVADSYIISNKTTNYCHLHKGKSNVGANGKTGKGYHLKESSLKTGRNAVMRFYEGEKVFKNQKYPLSFLIEKFPDMPGWTSERIEALKSRERAKGWNV